jgi:HD-like signal output (HDOD) protein
MPEDPKLQVEKSLSSLPVLPSTVAELMALDPNSEAYPDKLMRLVERDPAMAARLMSIANSVTSGPELPIRSIPQAIARLGARKTGQLFLSMAVMKVFDPKTEGEQDLWRHALQVAVASREIARASGWDVSPHEAYLLGLLHDIGRFVMFHDCPERVRGIEEGEWLEPHELLALEKEACGCDHGEIGWRACKAMSIPPALCEVIRIHHLPSSETRRLPPTQGAALRIVQQADLLSRLFLSGHSPFDLPPDERVALLEQKCILSDWDWVPLHGGPLERLLDPIIVYSNQLMFSVGVGVIRRRRRDD